MPFIYDNLIATLISTTVFLILISIQMRATQINTARTSRNIANTQAQNLATWLEEDLSRIGQNMSPDETPYDEPTKLDGSQWHTEFSFDYVDASGTQNVQYDLEKTGETRVIDGEEKDLFELKRAPGGASASNLEYFRIDLLNEDGNPASTPGDVEFVRARFSVIAPFQTEETFPKRVRRSIAVPYKLEE